MNNKKKITMLLLMVAATAGAYAQGNGMAGINEATKMVTSYFDPGTKLIYAIGAVVGLIGGIKVYNKFSCLLYTSPSPRDRTRSRMPSSA